MLVRFADVSVSLADPFYASKLSRQKVPQKCQDDSASPGQVIIIRNDVMAGVVQVYECPVSHAIFSWCISLPVDIKAARNSYRV